MKNQFTTLKTVVLAFSLSILFSNCSNPSSNTNDNQEETNGEEYASASNQDLDSLGDDAEGLSPLIEAYISMKNALANDQSEKAAEAADHMLGALRDFDQSMLNDSIKKSYKEIEETAKENMEHISKNSGHISHQREHFVSLSTDMDDMIKLIGTDKKLYQDFCPMADNKRGAIWISETKEIHNPYMGKKMPKCGSVQQEIN